MKKTLFIYLGLLTQAGLVMAETVDSGEGLAAVAVVDAALDDQRARQGVDPGMLGRGMTAILSDSTSISTNVSSSNSIGSGAFANASGIVSVIQNTGNNVVIQDSTLVNVRLMP